MSETTVRVRFLQIASAVALGLAVSGCVSGFTSTRTQGYSIPESSLQQIRVGQSEDLVIAVLGSPQTTGTFGPETAFYYVETTVEQTAFGLKSVKERKVLAVYFDKDRRVTDKALYALEDGRLITLETRRTKSFGEDRTFIESIISSF